LDKVIYNISKKDFIVRLLHMAVSRIRTIKGIIFNESFKINILRGKYTKIYIYRVIDIVKRTL
ncbi:hypothetical protein QR685DRAFT_451740, partial [Neurospora intermedia]